ncbi:uncharacterized protein LOC115244186 [Formica exsecta]|uniref:uncharacterized protein LOC115244186 n=1 Tax=Formica exsecta TaxID=72781 RepID=UPI0011448A67|nr:uncharacterized protein LOC115244186 [Formica exsecta]
MANSAEVTFEDFQTSERFKKLQRSLKLAVLKRVHSKGVHKKEMLPAVTAWPSISSISVDSMNSSCVTPLLHTSVVKSEVLASSNNLRNLSMKRNCKTNGKIMATFSVKQDDHSDRLVMPSPMRNTVYRISKETQDKVPTLPNCKTVVSNPLNRSVQSSTVNTFSLSATSHISANTNTSKEYLHPFVVPTIPVNDPQRVNRIFSRWRVMLNDNYELIIKGTLECGRVIYSKPVIRRYTATCVESKYKHKYSLQGNIVDERNVLPDYICGKFYNGFPDDWENVYQIWRTYVSQGCPVTFRWPTPITDSDDDLKSELTELTYISTNKKDIFKEPCKLFEYTKFENSSDKSSKKKKIYNCSTHSFQSYKEASLVKPLISNSKRDIIPIAQTRDIKLACDVDNEQNIELDVNPVYSSRGMNKLKDIIYEDKLKIIIDNLADRNCSPKYIDKIIQMFDCLDYTVSYRAKSECDYNSAVSASRATSCKQETLQPSLACDDNRIATNKFENEIKEQGKNCMNSTNLRYRSINNDSNRTQLSNPINVNPKHDDNNDSDESESRTYAGVPKISIERVLHGREASRKTYKHKVKKKSANSRNVKGIGYEFESAPTTIPTANDKNSLLSDESCISITEYEVKDEIDTAKYHKIKNIAQRSQEDTFYNHLMTQRNNFDVYGANKPAMQNKQSFNPFQAQKVNLDVSIKKQEVSHGVEENAHSQFVADVDYATISGVDVTVSTNTQKTDRNMITSHSNLDQDIVISSESNNNFPEKPLVFQQSHREYIEQSKNEIAMKNSKPSIISLMPVNLKLKIKEADSKSEQLQALDANIVENEEDKQYFNIQSLEEVHKKKSISKASIAITKAIIANDSHSKTTSDNKKKIYLTTNKKNESNVNSANLTKSTTNPITEQSKSNKLEIENDSKVLSAWMPKVIYYAKSKSELGLIFEGKLLNELGHVVQRKFTTDIVLKRLSATSIETVNHEFYKLVGYLNDYKHVIPKELAKQCRNGCPTNIEQFCLTWKMLQNCKIQKMSEKLNDTSMDSLNTSVSSRGRRIVPPLSYWTGERITLKDNNLVYNPGSSQKSSLISRIEISKELSTEKTKKQKANSKNISKEQKLFKSNKIPSTNKNKMLVIEKTQSSNKSYKTKAANSTKKSYRSNKSRKSWINGKRYIKQNLTFSSTDSSDKEQNVSPPKRMRTQLNTKTGATSQYTMTLRKRHKTEAFSNRNTTKLQ